MAKHDFYEKKTEELVLPILNGYGFEEVDLEFVKEAGNYYLRLYMDKPGGITIDDCEAVSRKLSDLLDENDFIEEAYTLEVSSPGLGRALKKERDFERNTGREIELKLYKAQDGLKELQGTLVSFDKTSLVLKNETGEYTIERKNLSSIREYVNWD